MRMKASSKRFLSLFLAVGIMLSLSVFGSGAALVATDTGAAASLFAKINIARAAVSKNALEWSDGLTKIAGAYAGILCDAGADFRNTTDFKTLPSGQRVFTLAAANDVSVVGFNYSVFIGKVIMPENTNEFKNKAVNGDFTRAGVACVSGTDGSYVTVITYDKIQVSGGNIPPPKPEPPVGITHTETWVLQKPDETSVVGVNSAEPDFTRESYETIEIGGSLQTLYRLPLLWGINGECIESAYFLMKPVSAGAVPGLRIAAMESSWVSYSMDEWWREYFSEPSTWNDVQHRIGDVLDAAHTMTDNGWVSLDVTGLVVDWLSGGRENLGFALSSDGMMEYYSIESDYSPKLVVTYRIDPPEQAAVDHGKFGFEIQPPGKGNCLSYALRDRVMIGYFDLVDTVALEQANDDGGLDGALRYVKGKVIEYVERYNEALSITGFREIASFDAPIDVETEYRIALRIGIGPNRIIEGMLDFDYHVMIQMSDGTWAEKLPGEYSRLASGSHAGSDPGKYPWNKGYMWGKGIEYNGFYNSNTVYFAVQKSADGFTEHKESGDMA